MLLAPWAAILLAVPVPQRLVADVEDAFALRTNPAGLAFLRGGEFRAAAGVDTTLPGDNPYVSFGAFTAMNFFERFSVGLGLEQDRIPNSDQLSFQAGVATGYEFFGLGFDYQRFDPFLGPAQDVFNLGLSIRALSWLAVGARFGDLSENLGDRTYQLSAAIRPFSRRIQLSGQWNIEQTPEFLARLQVEPIDGILLGLGASSEETIFTQLEIQLQGAYGIGGVANARRGGVEAGVVVSTSLPAPKSLISSRKVAVLSVRNQLFDEKQYSLGGDESKYGGLPASLRALYTRDDVAGLFVRIGGLSAGWAKIEESRRLLEQFKLDGRPVVCYLDDGSDTGYYLSTACSKVFIAPSTVLRVDGIASEALFFGRALTQLGVHFEVERIGTYKTSPERYTEANRSEAEREQITEYIDSLFESLILSVSKARGLQTEKVRDLVDRGVVTATAAEAEGLVDGIIYPDEVEKTMKSTFRGHVIFSTPARLLEPRGPRPWGIRSRIAVLTLAGTIGGGGEIPWSMAESGPAILEELERVRNDPLVSAVVLRINSPGGDAYLSDLVARKVQRLAQLKPVIASLGDVAASGGYYVAAPATKIVAEPSTLTGSIGIFSLKVDASSLAARLGIGVDIIQAGARAADQSPFLARSEAGDRAQRAALSAGYAQFLRVVSKGRNLPLSEVEAAAQGRVYSGRAALDRRLVDRLGGFSDALELAAELAGGKLSDFEVLRPGAVEPVFRRLPSGSWESALVPAFGAQFTAIQAQIPLLVSHRPLALMPYVLDVE